MGRLARKSSVNPINFSVLAPCGAFLPAGSRLLVQKSSHSRLLFNIASVYCSELAVVL